MAELRWRIRCIAAPRNHFPFAISLQAYEPEFTGLSFVYAEPCAPGGRKSLVPSGIVQDKQVPHKQNSFDFNHVGRSRNHPILSF